MTSPVIHKDERFDNFTEALNKIFASYMKRLNTGLPGIIDKFDKETRRAKVQVALKVLLDDGTEISRSPIVDVPVVFPTGGKYMLWFNLKKGDPVWLSFSQSGMTQFKESYKESQPDIAARFREMDAVAEPGFGPLEMTPARADGVSLQHVSGDPLVSVNDDEVIMERKGHKVQINDTEVSMIRGSSFVRMNNSGIQVGVGSQVLNLTSSGFNAVTSAFTHRGTNVGDTHTHGVSHPSHPAGGTSTSDGPS